MLKDTVFVVGGQVIKLVLLAAAFFIISRALGVEGLGQYITVFTIANLLGVFGDFGHYTFIIQEVSEKKSPKQVYSQALMNCLFIAIPLSICAYCFIAYFFPTLPANLIWFTLLNSLLFERVFFYFYSLHIGLEETWKTAVADVFIGTLRLGFALYLAFIATHTVTPDEWAFYILLSSMLCFIVSFVVIVYRFGFVWCLPERYSTIWNKGAGFVFSLLPATANNDADKLMLSFLGAFSSVGIYAAAIRLLNIVTLPLASFFRVAIGRFYKQDASQGESKYQYAKKILPFSVGIAAMGVVPLLIFTPFIIDLLGNDFDNIEAIIRFAIIIPVVQAIALPFGDALTASKHQNTRAKYSIFCLVSNLCLNAILIPMFDVFGALAATIVSQCLFATLCFIGSRKLAQ